MSLRDTNPYIDTDLALIISTFEKSMVNAESEEAVIAPFRREITSLRAAPNAVIESISMLPAFQDSSATTEDNFPGIPTRQSALEDDDEALAEAQNPSEDGDDQEEWIEKAKNWIEKCVSCDIRSLTKFDPNFYKDIKKEWEASLDKIEGSLDQFEKKVLDSDAVFSDLCAMAQQLKVHCIPDLSKIIWLLTFMLSKLNKQIEINLNIFETLVTGVLTPIFNIMISNLDLIDKLAVNPLNCVVDQLGSVSSKISSQAVQPTLSTGQNLQRLNQGRRQRSERAAVNRQQVLENSRVSQATQDVSSFISEMKLKGDFDMLQGYIRAGIKYVKNYKEWLLGLLREIIGASTESLNKKTGNAQQKIELLRLIGLIKAVIKAAQNGEFSCGADDDGLTAEDFKVLVDDYVNPNASLEIVLEDDSLVIKRDRRQEELDRSDNEASSSAAYNTASGVGTASGAGTSSGKETSSRRIPSNIVLTKKLSSCLKNVTQEEFSQVQSWIQGLEEGFSDD